MQEFKVYQQEVADFHSTVSSVLGRFARHDNVVLCLFNFRCGLALAVVLFTETNLFV